MDAAKLEQLARAAIESWRKWVEAGGWDNVEYDVLCMDLTELEEFLED